MSYEALIAPDERPIMKIATVRIVVLVVSGAAVCSLYSQQLPLIKYVTVDASAAPASASGILTFSYTVTNLGSNIGSISSIDIDISKTLGSATLSAAGLVNGPGFLEHSSEVILQQSTTVPMVPVGIQCPAGWVGSVAVEGTAGCGAAFDSSVIPPGATFKGFELTTRGLPGIRTFVAKSYLDVDTLALIPPADDNDLARYWNDLDAIENKVAAKATTIGPTAPPANLDPVQFMKTIISYKEQALKAGWVSNIGIVKRVDTQLSAALDALQGGDANRAKQELGRLLEQLDDRDERGLRPEAVALLKFNAQYLISKIDSGAGKDDKQDQQHGQEGHQEPNRH